MILCTHCSVILGFLCNYSVCLKMRSHLISAWILSKNISSYHFIYRKVELHRAPHVSSHGIGLPFYFIFVQQGPGAVYRKGLSFLNDTLGVHKGLWNPPFWGCCYLDVFHFHFYRKVRTGWCFWGFEPYSEENWDNYETHCLLLVSNSMVRVQIWIVKGFVCASLTPEIEHLAFTI